MAENNYWDSFDKEMKGSGGGAIVARCTVETGYKVYASGHTSETSFFAYDPTDKEDKAIAKASMKQFAKGEGVDVFDGRPGIQICVYVADAFVKGEAATWQGNRYFNVDGWTDAAKEVVIPALKELSIMPPFDGWLQIGFKPDPYGTKELDQNGEERDKLVAYPVRKFAGRQEALANLPKIEESTTTASPSLPDDYTAEEWAAQKPTIVNMATNQGKSAQEIAEFFGVDKKAILAVISG